LNWPGFRLAKVEGLRLGERADLGFVGAGELDRDRQRAKES